MLYYNILIPVILAVIINLIIYIFGYYKKIEDDSNPFIPAGYIIGFIWTFLLGILGYVNYLLYRLNNNINIGNLSIIILILYSLTYPFLIYIKKNNVLLLNMIGLILSFIVALIVILYSKYIFMYLIPLLLWISYVNIVFIIKKTEVNS
jgi:tryptophan-rich sensory protein